MFSVRCRWSRRRVSIRSRVIAVNVSRFRFPVAGATYVSADFGRQFIMILFVGDHADVLGIDVGGLVRRQIDFEIGDKNPRIKEKFHVRFLGDL